jgi:hypothetical protein
MMGRRSPFVAVIPPHPDESVLREILERATGHHKMHWLRLNTAAGYPLRRGAWYRVTSVTRFEAVVMVDWKLVSLPLPFVDIRTTPPREWTVLLHPTIAPRAPEIFQIGYLVCPYCRDRVVLPAARVRKQPCPRCRQIFPIAWDETYPQAVLTGRGGYAVHV